ncbi:Pyridine nucleotide-disulfide oxidoreductase [Abditibacterium utsteinense]|uniref:Pyridine nucleotide-disulfide oxidoreductase n=1 Tax=Abditibacterium utsteinense TaxID=1960156 RepID=A0A2S8SW58_9BACT|nr:FAD-dependent oxidoreductase [Abditibacterium utsteinense]PQV65028.1 Pyridine nucleotide-disulfide oxidoreductase [Abditibacterium utsteinense]
MTKIAIIGGGPIGIEAALYGSVAGFDVHLFERGRIGENVRQWGHVRLFTEWKRDRSPLSVRLLTARGDHLPDGESWPTGARLGDYLVKLASLEALKNRISPQTEVLSIAREAALKSDFYGDAARARRAFRLLTKNVAGEKIQHFDAVIDATGVYQTPNHAGNGGMLAPGETAFAKFIDYAIPDVKGADNPRFFNKHALVIGSGHSAASTLLAISDYFEKGPRTRITWALRRDVASDGSVYALDPNDISSGRQQLGSRANELAKNERVDFRPRTLVEVIERKANRFIVTFSDGEKIGCDTICAHTGFRPDETLWKELQISPHAATGAPSSQLAEALHGANLRAGVGLSTGYAEKLNEFERPENEAELDSTELLQLAEPNFYVLGIKSYGRDAGFLMQNGFRQVRDVYQLISKDKSLDLYNGEI